MTDFNVIHEPKNSCKAPSQSSNTATTLASSLLLEASRTIEDRASQRDTPDGERSMARATQAFNALKGGDARLTELDGWLFMCVLKMARANAGKGHLDDYVDLAGYAALAAECMAAPVAEPGCDSATEAKPSAWMTC